MTTAHSEAPTLVHEPSGEGLAAELLARRRKRLPAVTLTLALPRRRRGRLHRRHRGAEALGVELHAQLECVPRRARRRRPHRQQWSAGRLSEPRQRPRPPKRLRGRRHSRDRHADQGLDALRDQRVRQHRARAPVGDLARLQVGLRVGEDDPPRRHRHRSSAPRARTAATRPARSRSAAQMANRPTLALGALVVLLVVARRRLRLVKQLLVGNNHDDLADGTTTNGGTGGRRSRPSRRASPRTA